MDGRVSKESFAAYRNWQRYIKKAHPKLSDGLVKSTLVAYCLSMAMDGTNGLGCYTSDATIADDLELYDARAIRPYRHEAMRLGWFVWTGEYHGRSKVLDIAIPAGAPNGARETKPADAKHNPDAKSPYDCPACKPLLERLSNGELTVPQLHQTHHAALGV